MISGIPQLNAVVSSCFAFYFVCVVVCVVVDSRSWCGSEPGGGGALQLRNMSRYEDVLPRFKTKLVC